MASFVETILIVIESHEASHWTLYRKRFCVAQVIQWGVSDVLHPQAKFTTIFPHHLSIIIFTTTIYLLHYYFSRASIPIEGFSLVHMLFSFYTTPWKEMCEIHNLAFSGFEPRLDVYNSDYGGDVYKSHRKRKPSQL